MGASVSGGASGQDHCSGNGSGRGSCRGSDGGRGSGTGSAVVLADMIGVVAMWFVVEVVRMVV